MTSIRKIKKSLKRELNDTCDEIFKYLSMRRWPSIKDIMVHNALAEYHNLLIEKLNDLKKRK